MIAVYVWIALALIGLYLAVLNGLEAHRDFQALGDKVNGRRVIATGNLRREIVRGLVQLDFLAIGVLVLLDLRGAAAPGLILGAAGLALNSYLDRHDRLYLARNPFTTRDSRPLTQDEQEDLKFGLERRALEAEHAEDE